MDQEENYDMSAQKANLQQVPFSENHDLHGLVFGVAVALGAKTLGGAEWSTSLSIGSLSGALATAAMRTYGHPSFLMSRSGEQQEKSLPLLGEER